jgi:hypothetical protein
MLRIEKATDDTVGQFRKSIETELNESDKETRAKWIRSVCLSLDGVVEPRLLKCRFELLDDPRITTEGRSALVFGISRFRTVGQFGNLSNQEQEDLVVATSDYLSGNYPKYAPLVISRLASKHGPNGSENCIRRRWKDFQPFVRAACVVSFPDLITGDQEKELLDALGMQYPLPSDELIKKYVVQLDADSFRDREKAILALEKIGPAASVVLRTELMDPRSPESLQRVKRLLESIEKQDSQDAQVLESGVINLLEKAGTPRANAMIDAIAANSDQRWPVREARRIRDSRR